jgi:HNH endonuclease
MAMARATLSERFWSKVDKSGDCWVWTGSRDLKGYGKINIGCTPTLAHRVSWQIKSGDIPEGLFVLHRCDNPPCVNPAHLFIGTAGDNVQDMMSKGRQRKGWIRCGKGHPMSGSNLYIQPKTGKRNCAACKLERTKKRRSSGYRHTENARARQLYAENLEESRRKGREKQCARAAKRKSQ